MKVIKRIPMFILHYYKAISFLILGIYIYVLFTNENVRINSISFLHSMIVFIFFVPQEGYDNYIDWFDGFKLKPTGELVLYAFLAICFYFFIKHLTEKSRIKLTLLKLKPKNTYSHGNMKLMSNKEKKERFFHQRADDITVGGFLMGAYQDITIRIFGKKIANYRKKYFTPQSETACKDLIEKQSKQIGIRVEKENKLKTSATKIFNKVVTSLNFIISYGTVDMVMIDNQPIHLLIFGTSRSGKSITWIMTQIQALVTTKVYTEKQSFLVSDPKGEIFEHTAQIVKENGYEVLVLNTKDNKASLGFNPYNLILDVYLDNILPIIDLFDWDLIQSKSNVGEQKYLEYIFQLERIKEISIMVNSGRLNNLSKNDKKVVEKIKENGSVRIDLSKCEVLTSVISNSMIEVNAKNPFFGESAKNYFTAMTYFTMEKVVANADVKKENGKWELKNKNLYKFFSISNMMIEFNVLEQLSECGNGSKLDILKTKVPTSSKVRNIDLSNNDVISTFRTSLKVFDDENIKRITAFNSFDFKKIARGEKPYALYLITPDYESSHNKFITLFISLFYYTLATESEKTKSKKLNRKVFFILDEFANIPKIDDLTTKLTVCLGRGIQFAMAIQNKAQLVDNYGKEATETILDNAHNKIYLLAGDKDTRDWFSDQIGKTTIQERSTSGRELDESSVSYSEREKNLVSSDVLGKNPLGNAYCTVLRSNPMKQSLRPWFTYADYSKNIEPEEFFDKFKIEVKHKDIELSELVIRDNDIIEDYEFNFE